MNTEENKQADDSVDYAILNGVYDDDFSHYMNPPTE